MTEKKRYSELDVIRCVLIILVVMIHIVHFHDRFPLAKPFIYQCSMPGFVLLTGYLTNINKGGVKFMADWSRWLILYAVMETGYAVASYWLPVRDGIDELSLAVVLDKLLLHPIGPYWFLHIMLCGQLIAYAAYRFRKLWSPFLLLIVTYILCHISGILPEITLLFSLGVVLRQSGFRLVDSIRPSLLALLPIGLYFWLYFRGQDDLLAEVLMIYGTFSLILFVLGRKSAAAIRFIGRNTLPVFIFHPVFTALSKVYLPLFAFDGTTLLFTLFTVILSVAGSLAIAFVLDKTRLSVLLARPRLLNTATA